MCAPQWYVVHLLFRGMWNCLFPQQLHVTFPRLIPRDLTLELPFTLTHPKPVKPVISQMVTLPYPSAASKESKDVTGEKETGEKVKIAEDSGAVGDGQLQANGTDESMLMGTEYL